MDHRQLCSAAAAALAAVPANHRPEVLVGFDGFIDAIIDVVATRASTTSYTAMTTIGEYGQRVLQAAGKSANFELVVKQSKIGGNGPIMANALCSYDYAVTAIGVLGAGAIDPVFAPLAKRAKQVITLGPAGSTDALEFSDGKLMLGKVLPMEQVTYEHLLKTVGRDQLAAILKRSPGVATVNWTMTLGMTEIWNRLADEILPGLRPDRPLWFVDLADPAKRTADDQRKGLAALTKLQKHVDVVLGMNEMELRQVLAALGKTWQAGDSEWEQARKGCEIVRDALGISWAMCHLVKSAAVAWTKTGASGSAASDGFFDPKPKITTGAGDHFNAGFLAALLAGIEPAHAIQIGGATSGHYVRTAESPSRAQVSAFLKQHAESGRATAR
ncbi:MAG: carbohydrate kinase family protein [Planctomycetes bacterium]|nr:carbohydrate kinase family protein [Planctomycetota bacterium]